MAGKVPRAVGSELLSEANTMTQKGRKSCQVFEVQKSNINQYCRISAFRLDQAVNGCMALENNVWVRRNDSPSRRELLIGVAGAPQLEIVLVVEEAKFRKSQGLAVQSMLDAPRHFDSIVLAMIPSLTTNGFLSPHSPQERCVPGSV